MKAFGLPSLQLPAFRRGLSVYNYRPPAVSGQLKVACLSWLPDSWQRLPVYLMQLCSLASWHVYRCQADGGRPQGLFHARASLTGCSGPACRPCWPWWYNSKLMWAEHGLVCNTGAGHILSLVDHTLCSRLVTTLLLTKSAVASVETHSSQWAGPEQEHVYPPRAIMPHKRPLGFPLCSCRPLGEAF